MSTWASERGSKPRSREDNVDSSLASSWDKDYAIDISPTDRAGERSRAKVAARAPAQKKVVLILIID